MASLVQWLKFAGARDATTGAAIASGFAYFYSPTAPGVYLTVYQDAAETTPYPANTPVSLNAAGQAEVYIKDSAEILVTDALGATKHLVVYATQQAASLVVVSNASFTATTIDGVLTAIGTSIGVDAKYKDATSATARDVKDVLRMHITPQDYGAVGDGINNDSTALQNAINRAVAAKLPLYLPKGTYRITVGLTVNGSITIYGDGPANSIISSTSEAIDGITLTVANGQYLLRDFSVVLGNDTGNGNAAIRFVSGKQGTIERVAVTACLGIVLSYSDSERCIIRNCTASVEGSSGHTGIAYVLGPGSVAEECYAISTDASTKYCRGFDLYADAEAVGCRAESFLYGFLFQSSTGRAMTKRCYAYTCGTGFRPNGDASLLVGCRTYGSVTADVENYVSTPYQSWGNTWSGADASSSAYSSSSATTPAFYIDVTKTVNVFKATYGGNVTTVNVGFNGVPTLTPFTKYMIVVQMDSSTSASSGLTVDSVVKGIGLPASLSTGTYYTAMFMVADDGVSLCQVTAWLSRSGNFW
jgi:hypothetical protein